MAPSNVASLKTRHLRVILTLTFLALGATGATGQEAPAPRFQMDAPSKGVVNSVESVGVQGPAGCGIMAGTLGGAAGALLGAIAGYTLDRDWNPTGEDPGVTGILVGGLIGGGIGVAVGLHFCGDGDDEQPQERRIGGLEDVEKPILDRVKLKGVLDQPAQRASSFGATTEATVP